jgi:hypothetical protein
LSLYDSTLAQRVQVVGKRKTNITEAIMSDLKKTITDYIQGEQRHHADKIRSLKAAAKSLKKGGFNPNTITWNIVLNPFSARSGGESIDFKYRGKLQNAIKKAEQEFLRLNKHSDVASRLVFAVIAGVNIPIPKEYWNTFMSPD